jgi:aldehyde:ferredoxin oxidoreductase
MRPFRLLNIDLLSGENWLEEVSAETYRKYIGGASLAAQLLYPDLDTTLDPLSAEALLLFVTGPLTGTLGPSVGRNVVSAKSPATGLWGESNIGGHFGAKLRYAGIDGLRFVGRSAKPTTVVIDDGVVQFRSAEHLWGSADTYQTQTAIREEINLPGLSIACIGVGGENQIPFAVILCDHGRVAGRTGMGAVMGSKNLKAIAVRGTKPITLADPEGFNALRRQANIELKDENTARVLRQFGTMGSTEYFDHVGALTTKYYTKGSFLEVDRISGTTVSETILTGVTTCNGCVVACGRVVRLEGGVDRKGVEYETSIGFGPNLGISDMESITIMGDLCDRYGIDTISTSNIIGFVFLLYQEGIIPQEEMGTLTPEWGNAEAAQALIHQIVKRDRIGSLLVNGAKAVAEHYGVPEMAAQVNGLEMAYHDPRGLSGMALVYATSPRGACHNQSDYYFVDAWSRTEEQLGITYFRRQDGAEKAPNVAKHQDWRTVCNSLVHCILPSVSVDSIVNLLNMATGWEYQSEELMLAGERGWNLKRLINLRLGWKRENERLPGIMMKPLETGAGRNYIPPFEEMLRAYYDARQWDFESGHPTPDKLEELRIDINNP